LKEENVIAKLQGDARGEGIKKKDGGLIQGYGLESGNLGEEKER